MLTVLRKRYLPGWWVSIGERRSQRLNARPGGSQSNWTSPKKPRQPIVAGNEGSSIVTGPRLTPLTGCKMIAIPTRSFYRRFIAKAPRRGDIQLVTIVEGRQGEWPCYGYCRVTHELHRRGHLVNYKHVARVMRSTIWGSSFASAYVRMACCRPRDQAFSAAHSKRAFSAPEIGQKCSNRFAYPLPSPYNHHPSDPRR